MNERIYISLLEIIKIGTLFLPLVFIRRNLPLAFWTQRPNAASSHRAIKGQIPKAQGRCE